MRVLWFSLGLISLFLGMIGAVLPILPTVPFLLLATFGFARSSPRLHDWLITHPTYGHHIRKWQDSGAIDPKAKRLATVTIAGTFLISVVLQVPVRVLLIQAVILCAVLGFIWSRPPD